MTTAGAIESGGISSRGGTVQAKVRLEFGRQWLSVVDARALDVGSIVMLDCQADECVEVLADGRVIALGSPVCVDGKLAAQVKEMVAND